MESGQRWAERLEQELGGVRVMYFERIPSTSTRLKEMLLADQLDRPAVLAAGSQTAGRGTRQRMWLQGAGTAPGDIALTVAMPWGERLDPRVSLAAGVLAAEALQRAGNVRVGLKWPNDLLAGDPPLKVGGLLVEASSGWLLVGVGVNVNSRPDDFPPDISSELTTLSKVRGKPLDRWQLQGALAKTLLRELPGADLDTLMQRWLERDHSAGSEYMLHREGRPVRVTAQEVQLSGALVLADALGRSYEVLSYSELEG